MCLFISSVAFAQLLNICRLAQSVNKQVIYEHKRNVVTLRVIQECFGLYGQVTKRTWWMPRQ